MVDVTAKVLPYITDAELVAWDGCHKIYLALDDVEAEFFRNGYPHVVEATAEEMLTAVKSWWDASCGLRFVEGVRHNAVDPNAGFTCIISQFEDDESEDDYEDDYEDDEEDQW